MRAAQYLGPEKIALGEAPRPQLRDPTDAIVEVSLSAICGTDLHLYHGRFPGVEPGTVVGHEYVGRIVELADRVRTLRVGDRVAGAFHTACGHCWFCRRSEYSQCTNRRLIGLGSRFGDLAGSQAEYVRIPDADFTLHRVPDEITDERAIFIGDVLATAYFATRRGGVQAGDTVAVVGCGPVGLLTVACARLFGAAQVIAIDRIPERLDKAEELGAFKVQAGEDAVRVVKELTEGRGADIVLEAVGLEDTLSLAFRLVRGFGTVSACGVFTKTETVVSTGRGFDKDLTLRMGMANIPAQFGPVTEILRGNRLDPTSIVTHRLPLDQISDGYRLFDEKQAIKVLVQP